MTEKKPVKKSTEPKPVGSYSYYERLKWFWTQAHPNATPAEYEAAAREWAKKAGV